MLALYPRNALAADAHAADPGGGFHGVTLAHNIGSIGEVDELSAGVERVGAKILKKPEKTSWGGYSGYFSGPDGYLWENVYNPHLKIGSQGSVVLR